MGVLDKFGDIIDRVGGTEPFDEGLYGSTEMFADGFRHLYNHGILKRAVYDDAALQRLVNAGKIDSAVHRHRWIPWCEEGRVNASLPRRTWTFCRSSAFSRIR